MCCAPQAHTSCHGRGRAVVSNITLRMGDDPRKDCTAQANFRGSVSRMSRTHSLNKRAIRQAKETDRASELRLSACNCYYALWGFGYVLLCVRQACEPSWHFVVVDKGVIHI